METNEYESLDGLRWETKGDEKWDENRCLRMNGRGCSPSLPQTISLGASENTKLAAKSVPFRKRRDSSSARH